MDIDLLYTDELQWEDYDNSLGGNWKESYCKFGIPQRHNREDCPCSFIKYREGGDDTAFCNSEGTDCVCSSNFLSSGVCVPAHPPTCCETEWLDEAAGEVLIAW